jgi:hypothetical protein
MTVVYRTCSLYAECVFAIPCLNHVHMHSFLVMNGRCRCGIDKMLPDDLLETRLHVKEQYHGPAPGGAARMGAQLTSNPVSPHFNSQSGSPASTRPASPSAEVFKALGGLYYNHDTASVAHARTHTVTHTHTHTHTHSARDTSLAAPGLLSPAPAGAASKRGVEGQSQSATSVPHVSPSPSQSIARPMPPLNLTSLASSCQLDDRTPRSFTSSPPNPVPRQSRGLSPRTCSRAVQVAGADREKWRTERREQRAKMHIIKSNRASSKAQEALQQLALHQTLKVSVCEKMSTPSNPNRGCNSCFYLIYEYYTRVHMSSTILFNLSNVPPHLHTCPTHFAPLLFPPPPPFPCIRDVPEVDILTQRAYGCEKRYYQCFVKVVHGNSRTHARTLTHTHA